MLRRYNKKEAMVNGAGGYSQGTTSPSKHQNHYSSGYHNQSYQSYSSYGRSGTPPPPRNSSPIIHYPATYPQLQTKDVVCGFCKHRFYIGKGMLPICPRFFFLSEKKNVSHPDVFLYSLCSLARGERFFSLTWEKNRFVYTVCREKELSLEDDVAGVHVRRERTKGRVSCVVATFPRNQLRA